METKRQRSQRPQTFQPSKIHLRVVQDFVVNHCQGFDWAKTALGAIRARDLPTLLKLSKALSSGLHTILADQRNEDQSAVSAFRLTSQFVALVGKYQYPDGTIPGVDPRQAALDDLRVTERRNGRLNAIFRAHIARGTDRHWCLPLMRRVCCDVLGFTPFYERIFDQCDFSGGSSVLRSGGSTHFASKLARAEISGPQSGFDFFVTALSRNHHYTGVFLERDMSSGSLYYSWEVLHERLAALHQDVDYNKIDVVPKAADKGRTIGKEPEELNFLQKGIDLEIRAKLKARLKIDLSDQRRNQRFAYLGSTQKEDPYVTLDLKGASNGVLTELVRSLLPPRWFKLLDQTRSHYGMFPEWDTKFKGCKPDDRKVRYEMFCSMGNGFCFPLETLIFASAIIAAHRHCGHKLDYAVYGDDIIVRQSVALVTIECLLACGFRVNTDKTFIHGPFRESCGANWYGGQDVTPGYYKKPVTDFSTLYAMHNALHAWPDVQSGIRSTLQQVRHVVPEGKQYAWVTNQALRVPHDVCMSVKGTSWNRHVHTWSYPILVGLPVPDEDWVDAAVGVDPSTLIDHLLLTATLRGAMSHEPFHLRFSTKYVSRQTCHSAATTPRKRVAHNDTVDSLM